MGTSPGPSPELRDAVDGLVVAVSERPTELPLAAVAELAATGRNISVDLDADPVIVYVSPAAGVDLSVLSPREREVALLVVGGFTNAQISRALGISVHTVKDHVHSMLVKTELETRSQLIAAWHGGLLGEVQGRSDDRGHAGPR